MDNHDNLIYENENVHVVFDDMLVTAEMYCIANTAYNYYADLVNMAKTDITVNERIRSGETSWLFECCAALFRFRNKDGSVRNYDAIAHHEMKLLLMSLPYTYVQTMKQKVEFFFRLQEGLLSRAILPSQRQNLVDLAERIALHQLGMTIPMKES